MKKILGGIAAVVAALALTACGGDQHKGEHCTAHSTVLIPQTHMVGKVPITTYIYSSQCTQWAPNDPATVEVGK